MMNTAQKTALLIAVILRRSGHKIARITNKEFANMARHSNYSARYFVQVQEHLLEYGVALHEYPGPGYLLINLNCVSVNKTLAFENDAIDYLQDLDEAMLVKELDVIKTKPIEYNESPSETENELEKLWAFLCELAENKKVITYKDVLEAEELSFTHQRQIKRPLQYIRETCLTKRWPPLDALIINHALGRPKAYKDLASWDQDRDKVFQFDWGDVLDQFDAERYH